MIAAVAAVAATAALAPTKASPRREPRTKEVTKKDLLQQDCPLEEQDRFKRLELYVAEALHAWEPFSTLQESIAHDIVRVALDPGEPAVFPDDESRVKTATLLASVESHEGHGMAYVDRGVCNDPQEHGNPLLKNGGCDGGKAFSLFQIHPGPGIVLFDNGGYGFRRTEVRQGVTARGERAPLRGSLSSFQTRRVIDGSALVADRELAARTAIHMLRASLRRDGTLCEYSGEMKPCPKAVARLKLAEEWVREHPL